MSTGNLHNAMRSLTAATLIALSAVTLSCTKTQIEPETPKGPAIEFSTKDPWTKAPDKAALEAMRKGSFNVWGWFRGTTNGHVFDATEVYDATYNSETDSFSSTTPNWTYDPENPRYWMNGLYDFTAVYPFDTPDVTFNPQTDDKGNTILDGKPVLIIQDFNSSTQKDLLVALNTGIDGGNPPEYVTLNFKHVLTKVYFKIKQNIEEDPSNQYKVTSVSFSNVKNVGSYKATAENGNWTIDNNTVTNFRENFAEPVLLKNNTENGGIVEFYPWEDGLLLIPHSFQANAMQFRIEFDYIRVGAEDKVNKRFVEGFIPVSPIWQSNKIVTYELLISQEDNIKFAKPTIKPWEDSQTGSTIIIQ